MSEYLGTVAVILAFSLFFAAIILATGKRSPSPTTVKNIQEPSGMWKTETTEIQFKENKNLMEPDNPLNDRYDALALAVKHAQGQQRYLARDVIADAQEFLYWLNDIKEKNNGI